MYHSTKKEIWIIYSFLALELQKYFLMVGLLLFVFMSTKFCEISWHFLMLKLNRETWYCTVIFKALLDFPIFPLLYYSGFHLHILVFPLVHQFYSKIKTLVCSSFAND